MTTGNTLLDWRYAIDGSALMGYRHWRTWSGGDSPIPPKVKSAPVYHETIGYNGRKYRFRVYDSYSPKPKRVKNVYHPYSVTKHTSYDVPVTLNSGATYFACTTTVGSWTAATVALLDANDDLKLVNKLYEKVVGSDFNAAIAIGAEGREALEMIGGNAIRLAKSIHFLRRGDFSGAFLALTAGTDRRSLRPPPSAFNRDLRNLTTKTMSSYWLEIQYGWRPLLSDVHAAAEFLAASLMDPLSNTYRVRVFKGRTRTNNAGLGTNVYARSLTETDYHCRRLRGVISEYPSWPDKLGLTNPASIAWEIMPYSFVIDWFTPIGSWLQARSAVSSLKGTFYYSELKSREYVMTSLGRDPNAPFAPFVSKRGLPWSNSLISSRSSTTLLKVPLPVFQPLSKSLDLLHCLNGLSLLDNLRPKGRLPT